MIQFLLMWLLWFMIPKRKMHGVQFTAWIFFMGLSRNSNVCAWSSTSLLLHVHQAVQLESVSTVRVRYLIIVSTLASKQESVLLGMDFPNLERCVCVCGPTCCNAALSQRKLQIEFLFGEWFLITLLLFALPVCSDLCTIGLVLPVWSDTQVFLDGDG